MPGLIVDARVVYDASLGDRRNLARRVSIDDPTVHDGRQEFLPQDDQSAFEVTLRLPPGSSLEGSSEFVKNLEADLKTLPGVRDMLTVLGADQRRQVDRGSILIELVDPDQRDKTQNELMLMARDRVKEVS